MLQRSRVSGTYQFNGAGGRITHSADALLLQDVQCLACHGRCRINELYC